jgi:hypothetical protein
MGMLSAAVTMAALLHDARRRGLQCRVCRVPERTAAADGTNWPAFERFIRRFIGAE